MYQIKEKRKGKRKIELNKRLQETLKDSEKPKKDTGSSLCAFCVYQKPLSFPKIPIETQSEDEDKFLLWLAMINIIGVESACKV